MERLFLQKKNRQENKIKIAKEKGIPYRETYENLNFRKRYTEKRYTERVFFQEIFT